MAIPTRQRVEEARAREWTRNHLQHAYLMLEGIRLSILETLAAGNPNRARLSASASAIELEVSALARLVQAGEDSVPGSELSVLVCSWLAAEGFLDLADAIGISIVVVLDGHRRMFQLAGELVGKGRTF